MYGETPPVAVPVKETGMPGEGFEGEYVKLAARGWGPGAGLEDNFQAVNGCSSQWLLPLSQKTKPWTSREIDPEEKFWVIVLLSQGAWFGPQ